MSASTVTLSDTSSKQSSPRKSTVLRSKTHKPASVQSAIVARRAIGQSKRKIAMDLGISRNTVTSVMELNQTEQQIAAARQSAIDLAPAAINAIDRDLTLPGSGALGLRLLNDIGAIGEQAIDTLRRDTVRQRNAINVLVQPGASVTVQADTSSVTDKNCSGNSNETVTHGTGRDTSQGKQPKDGAGH